MPAAKTTNLKTTSAPAQEARDRWKKEVTDGRK